MKGTVCLMYDFKSSCVCSKSGFNGTNELLFLLLLSTSTMVDCRHSIAAVRSCISLLGKSTREGDMDDLWEIDDQKV